MGAKMQKQSQIANTEGILQSPNHFYRKATFQNGYRV